MKLTEERLKRALASLSNGQPAPSVEALAEALTGRVDQTTRQQAVTRAAQTAAGRHELKVLSELLPWSHTIASESHRALKPGLNNSIQRLSAWIVGHSLPVAASTAALLTLAVMLHLPHSALPVSTPGRDALFASAFDNGEAPQLFSGDFENGAPPQSDQLFDGDFEKGS